jgi:hypothetical protein
MIANQRSQKHEPLTHMAAQRTKDVKNVDLQHGHNL